MAWRDTMRDCPDDGMRMSWCMPVTGILRSLCGRLDSLVDFHEDGTVPVASVKACFHDVVAVGDAGMRMTVAVEISGLGDGDFRGDGKNEGPGR